MGKVFSIVDKDHSGHIDMNELQDMFKLFKEDASLLSNTIQRIMKHVDKDFDGLISKDEFYVLLSQTFEKGDPRRDIEAVFRKMADQSGNMTFETMKATAAKLGEQVSPAEIKDMLAMFNQEYQRNLKANNAWPKYQQR